MKKIFRRACSAVSTIVVAAAVLLAVLLVGVRLVGLEPYTVLSGSMEPVYHVGSLLYVQKVDVNAMQAGDPVTYRMASGAVVTHRIVEVVEDPSLGRCYRTRGDANNIADGPLLKPSSIIGKPLFSIPYLGYVSVFVQNPPGLYIAIAVCLGFFSLSIMLDLIFPQDEKKVEEVPETEEEKTGAEEVQ